MKTLCLVLVWASVALAKQVSTDPMPTFGTPNPELRLMFEDEFDIIDRNVWQHEITMGGGGNWEFQVYHHNTSNSYVRDSVLYIKPTLTEDKYGDGFVQSGTIDLWGGSDANQCTSNEWWGCMRTGNPDNILNPLYSARLRSSRGFSFKYGRVEVRARMPKGDWLWPAIWMLPKWEEYGTWPASGEIDLVESRGNLDLKDQQGNEKGHGAASQSMHWGPYFPENRYEMTTGEQTGNFGDDFHRFQMVWDADHIQLLIDDVETFSVRPDTSFWEHGGFDQIPGIDNPWLYGDKMAPFDREFHFILNNAVGGTLGYFSDDHVNGNGPKPWENDSPVAARDFWNGRGNWLPTWIGEDTALAVDYVRVWSE